MHVGIVMGSDSDLPVMKKAFSILDDFGVTYDVTIASAHRTPKKLADFVAAEEEKGVGAFIAGAGMAAALPGVVASLTLKPVIGVPLSGAKLDGMDALFSIVQMPSGRYSGDRWHQECSIPRCRDRCGIGSGAFPEIQSLS